MAVIQQLGANVYYVAPPGKNINHAASFLAGWLKTRTPWARQLFMKRLNALDPTGREAALAAMERDRRSKESAYQKGMVKYEKAQAEASEPVDYLKGVEHTRIQNRLLALDEEVNRNIEMAKWVPTADEQSPFDKTPTEARQWLAETLPETIAGLSEQIDQGGLKYDAATDAFAEESMSPSSWAGKDSTAADRKAGAAWGTGELQAMSKLAKAVDEWAEKIPGDDRFTAMLREQVGDKGLAGQVGDEGLPADQRYTPTADRQALGALVAPQAPPSAQHWADERARITAAYTNPFGKIGGPLPSGSYEPRRNLLAELFNKKPRVAEAPVVPGEVQPYIDDEVAAELLAADIAEQDQVLDEQFGPDMEAIRESEEDAAGFADEEMTLLAAEPTYTEEFDRKFPGAWDQVQDEQAKLTQEGLALVSQPGWKPQAMRDAQSEPEGVGTEKRAQELAGAEARRLAGLAAQGARKGIGSAMEGWKAFQASNREAGDLDYRGTGDIGESELIEMAQVEPADPAPAASVAPESLGAWFDSLGESMFGESGEGRRANAKMIVEMFNAEGLSKEIALAAVANAQTESQLSNKAVGDGGSSVGLFQLRDVGAGQGMTEEERMEPAKNIARIIQIVKSADGQALLAAQKAGASVPELAEIFSRDIERPAKENLGRAKKVALEIFGEG